MAGMTDEIETTGWMHHVTLRFLLSRHVSAKCGRPSGLCGLALRHASTREPLQPFDVKI
jgi:hypothetical protein